MKILAFGATNSRNSINQQFARYAASLVPNAEVEVLDLNDYELPIFSFEREEQLGQPELAQKFYKKLGEADAIIISFAEHNGSYAVAYKNTFDWVSRINQKVFQEKPMLLLATSPGPGGAASVLGSAVGSAPYFAGDVRASVSLPSFYDNFDMAAGKVTNAEIDTKLKEAVEELVK
ncbi:NADPH-dependent FMN reductase [Photobacterium damselae]|uniref:NADPH-dependent FMN reductase n=1 Tax=Photobacterium damselae TaxID=38293 RepID=A0ACD3SW17_PHODM|nr:NAD(P)H-dependent oxidoreductase [Photobacterium damselae]RDL32714.1 NADPH-dependent FMN reductase [Photobacterium damselae]TMX46478.1 NADPH-dependent FMN reductase [Photobacterium damselae]TMX63244.1 NADPH-dependent FMN reductase [Photobacterium damselae]TMX72602.1 NADPH-dependent FMN reductase [Photobacterium damselae]